MTPSSFKVNNAQQRICQVLMVLAGQEEFGVAQSAIAKAVKSSDSRLFNDLRNLQHAGFVEQLENKCWRLGPRLVQVSNAFHVGITRMKARALEIEQRYSREPR
ncbi:MAG: hypothetical protein HYV17_07900 [Xanthomonadales bacterium]|nr:hypothetical protein [Xanthomonadales bacterium]